MFELYQNFFAANPLGFPILMGLLGLLIGSFLNVVAYRLPLRLEQDWIQDANYIQAIIKAGHSLIRPRPLEFEQNLPDPQAPAVTLSKPRSHCPACKTPIKAWQNIPLVSFLILKGRCANAGCDAKIPRRYFAVELFTGVLSFIVTHKFGLSVATAGALIFTWALIALTLIDFDTQLLPDQIVLPGLWLGLLINYWHVYVPLDSAVLGAVFGYMSLWSVFHIFKILTKKEGMGFGDFKLFAAIGAWFGVAVLPAVIMIASLLGSVVGVGLILARGQNSQKPIAFGPYLAIAGWLVMIYQDVIDGFLPFTDFVTLM